MQTTSDLKRYDNLIKNKIDSFSKLLKIESFFLLFKPNNNIYKNILEKDLIERKIEKLMEAGLKNIEITWSNNKSWIDYMKKIKLKFPQLNLGSASILNKKSIEDSIESGLSYSMMKFWDRDLQNYAKEKNHLLIPGIKNIKDLKEAIDLNCKIIKVYPVKNISQYRNIHFIAAGGLSISDIKLYKSKGYKAIVIGDKAFKNKDIDPKIYEWLKGKYY